jgi:hypothetical protein
VWLEGTIFYVTSRVAADGIFGEGNLPGPNIQPIQPLLVTNNLRKMTYIGN